MKNENLKLKHWVAPDASKLPDFIIGGAMKCGTSTLHYILNQHPNIFIPTEEIGFFDIDHLLEHPDFVFFDPYHDEWIAQLMEDDPPKMWNWYSSKFQGYENCVIGEDSTTYMVSGIAAERIAIQNKNVRLIFLLRNPTDRAYSQYFHMLRTGRAVYNFENSIRYEPYSILNRSLYKAQLEKYYELIPKERIKVVLFEDLANDKVNTIRSICNFLNVDFHVFDPSLMQAHSNKAMLPKYQRLQLLRNRYLRFLGNLNYGGSLPNKPKNIQKRITYLSRMINRLNGYLNPLTEKEMPAMKASTRKFLDQYFVRELDGLDELIGQDALTRWFSSTRES